MAKDNKLVPADINYSYLDYRLAIHLEKDNSKHDLVANNIAKLPLNEKAGVILEALSAIDKTGESPDTKKGLKNALKEEYEKIPELKAEVERQQKASLDKENQKSAEKLTESKVDNKKKPFKLPNVRKMIAKMASAPVAAISSFSAVSFGKGKGKGKGSSQANGR